MNKLSNYAVAVLHTVTNFARDCLVGILGMMTSRHDGYFQIMDRDWWAKNTITVVLVSCCISADTSLPLRI